MVKYDSSGEVIWARQAGSKQPEEVLDLAIDKSDNILLAGDFYNHTAFDTIVINSISEGLVTGDVFLAKYDSSGTPLWAQAIGGKKPAGGINFGTVQGTLVAVDTVGNAFIGGNYADCYPKIGGTYLGPFSYGNYNMWFAKYSPSGSFSWARTAGSIEPDYLRDMAADRQGNVYITGEYGYDCVFNSDTAHFSPLNPDGFSMFVCKYDPAGNVSWLNAPATDAGTAGYGIAIDYADKITVAGTFAGRSLALGPSTIYNGGTGNGFVAKMGAPTGIISSAHTRANIEFYPNPATDKINIRFNDAPGFTQYTLINALGQQAAMGRLTSKPQQVISLPVVPGGLYYLCISGDRAAVTYKLNIVH